MQFLIKKFPLLGITAILALTLAACGSDAQNGENTSTPSTPPGDITKCANPIALSDVPSGWTSIESKDLITGKNGRYELKRVRLHGEFEQADGNRSSATTDTIVLSRNLGQDGIVQTVTCKNMGNLKDMSLNSSPMETILLQNGRYTSRLSISFKMDENSVQKFASIQNVKESAAFGKKTIEAQKWEDALKKEGVDHEQRIYKISDDEFEMRMTATFPDQTGGSKTVTIDAALRYQLVK